MMKGKANELLAQYMQAELKGQDDLAESLENQLNEAGWFIVTGQDGLMVEKRQEGGGFMDSFKNPFSNSPKESSIQPYSSTKGEKSGSNLWLIIGISVGSIAFIVLVVYLIKRFKKKNG